MNSVSKPPFSWCRFFIEIEAFISCNGQNGNYSKLFRYRLILCNICGGGGGGGGGGEGGGGEGGGCGGGEGSGSEGGGAGG